MSRKKYEAINALPSGRATEDITEGCLVLEGGAWRGVYTVGVLDAMMTGGINLSTAVGISAGALSALSYISGQIGWGIRIDLTYRHDPNYCGVGAFARDHGITGFSYLFNEIMAGLPLDMERLMSPRRRLFVGAADMRSGKLVYFEKGKCDLFRAVRASATVPFISRPVIIDGAPYIDGGCVDKIPSAWANENEAGKKLVGVKTRERSYRREEKASAAAR
ncbi:MAG: patatin family protein, partial [Oscillospiraceae bacterium]|nr:patatin family protein [Oscillospiraceae bacterium]